LNRFQTRLFLCRPRTILKRIIILKIFKLKINLSRHIFSRRIRAAEARNEKAERSLTISVSAFLLFRRRQFNFTGVKIFRFQPAAFRSETLHKKIRTLLLNKAYKTGRKSSKKMCFPLYFGGSEFRQKTLSEIKPDRVEELHFVFG
jgi:hypothetical protein